MSVYR